MLSVTPRKCPEREEAPFVFLLLPTERNGGVARTAPAGTLGPEVAEDGTAAQQQEPAFQLCSAQLQTFHRREQNLVSRSHCLLAFVKMFERL